MVKEYKEQNGKRNRNLISICELILTVSLLAMLGFLIYGLFGANEKSDLEAQYCYELNDGWTFTDGKGNKKTVSLPYIYEGEANELVAMEVTLPDNISDKDVFSTRLIRQDVNVFIDGKLRLSQFQSDEGIYRDDLICRNIYVDLTSADAGKKLRIEALRYIDGDRNFFEAQYGLRTGLLINYLQNDSLSLVLSFVFLAIGIICVIGGIFIRIMSKNMVHVDFMGWAVILVAIWDLTQSSFRDFLFSNLKTISVVPAISLMVFPIPLALFFNNIQRKRYIKIYTGFIVLDFAYMALRYILQLTKVMDMFSHIELTFGCVFLLMAVVIGTSCHDIKSGHIKLYLVVLIGFIVFALAGIIQVVNYITGASDNGVVFCLGLGVLMITAVIQGIRDIVKYNSDNRSAMATADMKSQFLANMSHEIRTPINAVLGMNEAILRESKEDVIKSYAADVDSAGHLLLSLINDILDFSKLESGKMSLVNNEYSVKDLIVSCYNLVQKKASDKALDFVVDASTDIPSVLFGDEVRIKQIIVNILNNAVKYTNEGNVGLKVNGHKREDGLYLLEVIVSDTGIGIKAEDTGKLFSAFERFDENKNKNIEGTGLGLAITSQLVDLMGGSISVNSEYGRGSVFYIKIPQIISDEKPIGKLTKVELEKHAKPKEKVILFKAPNARLLIVDDVPLNIKVAMNLLKDTDMGIDTAFNGDEAIELTKKYKYDIILLDHMMPDKDGIETLKEMKQDPENINKETPVVMLTANAIVGAKDEYLEAGFADYLSKPFSAEEIQNMVSKHIETIPVNKQAN